MSDKREEELTKDKERTCTQGHKYEKRDESTKEKRNRWRKNLNIRTQTRKMWQEHKKKRKAEKERTCIQGHKNAIQNEITKEKKKRKRKART